MTADSFKRRLLELALALREDAAATLGPDGGATCDRCGRDAFAPTGLETETVVEYYALVCPVEGCDGEATFAHLFVGAGDGPRVVARDFAGAGCTNDACDPTAHLAVALIRDKRPFRRLEYHLPVAGLLERPVLERDVGDESGRASEICRPCYGRLLADVESEPEPAEPEPRAPTPQ